VEGREDEMSSSTRWLGFCFSRFSPSRNVAVPNHADKQSQQRHPPLQHLHEQVISLTFTVLGCGGHYPSGTGPSKD
jgi:hypothetical protein